MVLLDDAAGERQSQAPSAAFGGIARLENGLLLLRRNALARVGETGFSGFGR